jgi:hypothetical protein
MRGIWEGDLACAVAAKQLIVICSQYFGTPQSAKWRSMITSTPDTHTHTHTHTHHTPHTHTHARELTRPSRSFALLRAHHRCREGHTHCEGCIKKYLKTHKTCPDCNTKVRFTLAAHPTRAPTHTHRMPHLVSPQTSPPQNGRCTHPLVKCPPRMPATC